MFLVILSEHFLSTRGGMLANNYYEEEDGFNVLTSTATTYSDELEPVLGQGQPRLWKRNTN